MDSNEEINTTKQKNLKKNRKTLILLFVMFITPVALAYAAYFGNWLSGSGGAKGELINSELITDVEDYDFIRQNGKKISGKEFETLYWWIVPIDPETCNEVCAELNLYTVNQIFVGLGKEASRIKELAILPTGFVGYKNEFPHAASEFTSNGVKALRESQNKPTHDLEANYIYLVDPLGNIFMRYPFIKDKNDAPILGKKLRKDILHLYKYSRLG
ncbi:MAG: hypothetical protein COA86_14410 [Kangiella sp.]|nr:MAG: hypothetical protein COA86_14410 [Kangiella sp.]